LHLLGGLERPTQGEVFVAGRQVDVLGESARAVLRRETIGFVFQTYNLIPNLTVADNVEIPALLVKANHTEASRRRGELLEALGIAHKARAFPGELSGGEQQRVAVARALVNHPAVLLVDEPTGNLDSRSGGEVMNLLRRFHAEGQTILLVTHDPKVAGYAGRVIFMRDGQLVDQVELSAPGDGSVLLSRLVELEL
jgi:putative ABC transport system ATP-binding protein